MSTMGQRLQLQILLEEILGSREVYFQTPVNVQMKYPCIIYKLDDAETKFADNRPYLIDKRYQVTVIDRSPDSPIFDKITSLPTCSFERAYPADNLNHFVVNIFF